MTESPTLRAMRAKKAFTDQFIIAFVANAMLHDYILYRTEHEMSHEASMNKLNGNFKMAHELAEKAWESAYMFHVEFGEVNIKDAKHE